jgi:hypothetical protein
LPLSFKLLRAGRNCKRLRLKTLPADCKPLAALAAGFKPDAAKIHAALRDLVRVFEGLAENAQAFMAGVARSIELQQAEASAVATQPTRRLIDYLERFNGDLVRRSHTIVRLIVAIEPNVDAMLGWSPNVKPATLRPAMRKIRRRSR